MPIDKPRTKVAAVISNIFKSRNKDFKKANGRVTGPPSRLGLVKRAQTRNSEEKKRSSNSSKFCSDNFRFNLVVTPETAIKSVTGEVPKM